MVMNPCLYMSYFLGFEFIHLFIYLFTLSIIHLSCPASKPWEYIHLLPYFKLASKFENIPLDSSTDCIVSLTYFLHPILQLTRI